MRLVLADVEVGALERASTGLRGSGAEVLDVVTDVADPRRWTSWPRRRSSISVRRTSCATTRASAGSVTRQWDGPLADWEWVVGINLMGVVHGIRAFGTGLVDQDEGAIVNTASLAALVTLPVPLALYRDQARRARAHRVAGPRARRCAGRASRPSAVSRFLEDGISASERNWPRPPGSEAGVR